MTFHPKTFNLFQSVFMLVILHSSQLSHKNGTLWHVLNKRLIYLFAIVIVQIFFSLPSSFLPVSVSPSFPLIIVSGFCFQLCYFLKCFQFFSSSDILLGKQVVLGSQATFLVNFKYRLDGKQSHLSEKFSWPPLSLVKNNAFSSECCSMDDLPEHRFFLSFFLSFICFGYCFVGFVNRCLLPPI